MKRYTILVINSIKSLWANTILGGTTDTDGNTAGLVVPKDVTFENLPSQSGINQFIMDVTGLGATTTTLTPIDLNGIDMDTLSVMTKVSVGNITIDGKFITEIGSTDFFPIGTFEIIAATAAASTPAVGNVKSAASNVYGPFLVLDIVNDATADIEIYIVAQKK